jgi:putative lipoic acid-binding regulatory protein
MIIGENGRRPRINYPCEWGYKVIGNDVEKLLSAIDEATSGLEYSVTPSNVSSSGKYYSVNVKIKVVSEEERNVIYKSLENHNDILMVM